MQKNILFLIMVLGISTLVFGTINSEVDDSDGESTEFWGPDWIPHPHPPHPDSEDGGWATF